MFSFAEEMERSHVEEADIRVEKAALKEDGSLAIEGYGRLAADGRLAAVKNGAFHTATIPAKEPLPAIPLGPAFDFAADKPNSLNTDCWKMAYAKDGDDVGAITSGRADYAGWLDMRMGAWEMQLPMEREEEVYPVDLWYGTKVQANIVPDDLKLMIDGFKGRGYTLYVNGRQVTEAPERSYLDAEIKTVPMAGYFIEGTNWITVRLTVAGKSDGMTDLLKIIGSFSVKEIGGAETICPPVEAL